MSTHHFYLLTVVARALILSRGGDMTSHISSGSCFGPIPTARVLTQKRSWLCAALADLFGASETAMGRKAPPHLLRSGLSSGRANHGETRAGAA